MIWMISLHWEKSGAKTLPLWRMESFFSKIVQRVELSYVPWIGSRGGAVFAPLFSQCRPRWEIWQVKVHSWSQLPARRSSTLVRNGGVMLRLKWSYLLFHTSQIVDQMRISSQMRQHHSQQAWDYHNPRYLWCDHCWYQLTGVLYCRPKSDK